MNRRLNDDGTKRKGVLAESRAVALRYLTAPGRSCSTPAVVRSALVSPLRSLLLPAAGLVFLTVTTLPGWAAGRDVAHSTDVPSTLSRTANGVKVLYSGSAADVTENFMQADG